MDQPARLKKMTSVRKQGRFIWRNWASKAFTGPLSNRSDNGNYTDPLKSNKPRPSKALLGLEILIESATPARLL